MRNLPFARSLPSALTALTVLLAIANRRLARERRRLAAMIGSLGDGLIVTEADQATISVVNPRARELVPELVPGSRIDAPESPLPDIQRALAGDAIVEHHQRTLAITTAALTPDHDGSNPGGMVWTIRDTTDRARLDRAKSEFVVTASHELRGPLTSIKGFVELLERSPGSMSARQLEFVEIIMRSTDRLVDLVNDLLDVARIEADRFEVTRRPIDVAEPVREVLELIAPRIADKRQHLTTDIAADLPLAYADPGRVRQIVGNLVSNAHMYTPAEGKIEVSVSGEGDGDRIQITVSDTGIGMTPEQVTHVFDRFYRASGHTVPGTGLGLSIVKSLVEMHKGEVDLTSEAGRGTTFRVRLPRAPAEAKPAPIRGGRVLIVDDERDIADLIARQLQPLRVEPTIVTDPREALDELRNGGFDAVTLDVLMPDMDGLDVLREIRSDPRLRPTPIVFVSVFSARSELTGEWVVSKPIDADELRRMVGTAVRAGRLRLLVVAREELREVLEPALCELGIEVAWESDTDAVARRCAESRFEVAIVDVGVAQPQKVLQALDLRGRRLRRAVILCSDDGAPPPPAISGLGMEVVPVQRAASALTAVLERQDG